MSKAFENDDAPSVGSGADAGRATVGVLEQCRAHVLAPVRFVGFWSAVVLPFLYLPLLLGGLDGTEWTVFLSLLALDCLALLAGHSYGRE
ncbi:hypothetical protein [Halomicrococcus sp. NG-SE-24]|uniref:hypothetical protein n=1 Tax=Halomicrococcus sp. NG-SE-24 TaxID=3436928 RepID=UPI003D971757